MSTLAANPSSRYIHDCRSRLSTRECPEDFRADTRLRPLSKGMYGHTCMYVHHDGCACIAALGRRADLVRDSSPEVKPDRRLWNIPMSLIMRVLVDGYIVYSHQNRTLRSYCRSKIARSGSFIQPSTHWNWTERKHSIPLSKVCLLSTRFQTYRNSTAT